MSTHPPVLPGMFEDGIKPRPHKRVRQTSKLSYHLVGDEAKRRRHEGRETLEDIVLIGLAAFWNRWQFSPTAYELFRFLQGRGEHRLRDVAVLRPRLTALLAKSIVEPRSKRRCNVTGAVVHTWAIREAGSKEAQ